MEKSHKETVLKTALVKSEGITEKKILDKELNEEELRNYIKGAYEGTND